MQRSNSMSGKLNSEIAYTYGMGDFLFSNKEDARGVSRIAREVKIDLSSEIVPSCSIGYYSYKIVED